MDSNLSKMVCLPCSKLTCFHSLNTLFTEHNIDDMYHNPAPVLPPPQAQIASRQPLVSASHPGTSSSHSVAPPPRQQVTTVLLPPPALPTALPPPVTPRLPQQVVPEMPMGTYFLFELRLVC